MKKKKKKKKRLFSNFSPHLTALSCTASGRGLLCLLTPTPSLPCPGGGHPSAAGRAAAPAGRECPPRCFRAGRRCLRGRSAARRRVRRLRHALRSMGGGGRVSAQPKVHDRALPSRVWPLRIVMYCQQSVGPNLVPRPNLVLFASTTVYCAGRPATRYRAARGLLTRVSTAFQGSKCVRGGLQGTRYHVKARYQIRTNALPRLLFGAAFPPAALLFLSATSTMDSSASCARGEPSRIDFDS